VTPAGVPLTNQQIEGETRTHSAVMDGRQLQWLLEPTIPLNDRFCFCTDADGNEWSVHEPPDAAR